MIDGMMSSRRKRIGRRRKWSSRGRRRGGRVERVEEGDEGEMVDMVVGRRGCGERRDRGGGRGRRDNSGRYGGGRRRQCKQRMDQGG